MAPRVEDPSDSEKFKVPTWKKLLAGGAAVASVNMLAACNNTDVEAVPQPNETTTTTSAPVTPGEVVSTPAENTPSPTTTSTPETPAPSVAETTQNNRPEVPPFREWNIAPDTVDRLQSAETDAEKWSIIKEVIVNNNKPGTYEGDTTLKTRSIEALFNRTLVEMATVSDIAQDPNVEDGDIISQEWASLAIIDEGTRAKFLDLTSNMRKILTTSDQEKVDRMIKLIAEEPFYHLQPEILHASSDINHFHDSATGRDYNGITFTGIYEVPDYYNEGFVTTITVVFDSGNYATQILREYPESDPGGWEISFDPNAAPIKVSEIPAVKEKTGS